MPMPQSYIVRICIKIYEYGFYKKAIVYLVVRPSAEASLIDVNGLNLWKIIIQNVSLSKNSE